MEVFRKLRLKDGGSEGAISTEGSRLQAVPRYRRRSVEVALDHLRQQTALSAPPSCVLLGDGILERLDTAFGGRFAQRLGALPAARVCTLWVATGWSICCAG